jgi:hypothetical protein
MGYKVKLERELTDEFLGDILVTVFDGNYGGCWYWADWTQDTGQRIQSIGTRWLGVEIVVKDDTSPRTIYMVDYNMLTKGIQALLNRDAFADSTFPDHLVSAILEMDSGEIDGDLADVIVQMGLFEEVRYG